MMRSIPSLIAAGVATLTLSSAAWANGVAEPLNTRVAYGDLNLASDAGVAQLYSRLRGAARQVCEYATFRDVVDQNCVARALDAAVAGVGSERLTALHQRTVGASRLESGVR